MIHIAIPNRTITGHQTINVGNRIMDCHIHGDDAVATCCGLQCIYIDTTGIIHASIPHSAITGHQTIIGKAGVVNGKC